MIDCKEGIAFISLDGNEALVTGSLEDSYYWSLPPPVHLDLESIQVQIDQERDRVVAVADIISNNAMCLRLYKSEDGTQEKCVQVDLRVGFFHDPVSNRRRRAEACSADVSWIKTVNEDHRLKNLWFLEDDLLVV